MNAQGQKTGGRQKGTPNKLTASMKYLTKALFLNNYDLLEQSFQQCKPAERLNFYAKMQPYLCAHETSTENGGEWIIGQNMEHLSIQQIELESLYQKLQNVELSYINALSNFQKTANERWNDIKEQMAAAQDYGVEQEKLNDMFKNLYEQYLQQYEQNHTRLDNSFEITRQNIQKKINEQESMIISTPSNIESTTTAVDQPSPSDDSTSQHSDSTTQKVESTSQYVDSTTQHVDSTSQHSDSTTQHVDSNTHATEQSTTSEPATTPTNTPTSPNHTEPMPDTHGRKSAPATQSHAYNKQQNQHIPFYANLKQKRKLRRGRK